MGGGSYSFTNSHKRSIQYQDEDDYKIFSQRTLHREMNPANTIRECCDSEEHQETVPIIIGLDVTGSMGYIPSSFIREGMTKMMSVLYGSGLKDSEVLFMGIGDHRSDRYPLQVGQFEADDELMDKWLKTIYLEGGGGGNGGESYHLAWAYGAYHTKIDSMNKRGKKGFLFTIGDENYHKTLSIDSQKRVFGSDDSYSNKHATELLKDAQNLYHVFHFHITDTRQGSLKENQNSWKELMCENVIFIDDYNTIPDKISSIINEVNEKNSFTFLEPIAQEKEEIIL